MKKGYLVVLFLAFVLASCSNKDQTKVDDKQAFQIDSVSKGGAQRMQVSDSEVNVKLRGKDYHIAIHRAPGDSLQRVKDQAGDYFVDNQITLQITRNNGEKVFSKMFTKRSFASVVDDSFLARAILEGMVYDKVTDDGIVLAASVCYPQTDLYIPIKITVTPDGKMSIVKEEILDENYTEEDSLN